MLKKILLSLGVIVIVLCLGAVGAYVATNPQLPAVDSTSAAWLQPGRFSVGQRAFEFVDTTRKTDANGEFTGAATRTLVSEIWYPEDDSADHPLVVYSHGFMSNKLGGEYLARALASRGYVVVAADFPLTNGDAPGGPLVTDFVNQPADVSFLIDAVLNLTGASKPFTGQIDAQRIGVAGISLGGLTSTLVGYHPTLRDPRVGAVISIAGPAYMFDRPFFATSNAPFLMIAGSIDAIVDYGANASQVPQRVPQGTLVTIEGGSHVGFVSIAEPMMRAASNPDGLACGAILAAVANATQGDAGGDPFAGLGGPAQGIVTLEEPPGLCAQDPLPESLHPGRQHMITKVALLSFFESVFAGEAGQRAAAAAVLRDSLANDFVEASVSS